MLTIKNAIFKGLFVSATVLIFAALIVPDDNTEFPDLKLHV